MSPAITSFRQKLIIHKESLEVLRPVLLNWTELVSEYSEKLGDQCYWYNERANISVLSAAAWRTKDWLALEEYTTYKHGENGNPKYGRCDLYITKDDHEKSFAIEAKQAWQNIGGRAKSSFGESKRMFKESRVAAGRLYAKEAKVRLGICFIAPMLPKSTLVNDEELFKWLNIIESKLKPDAMAWVFPKTTEEMSNIDGRVYPGTCLIIKECLRGSRKVSKTT